MKSFDDFVQEHFEYEEESQELLTELPVGPAVRRQLRRRRRLRDKNKNKNKNRNNNNNSGNNRGGRNRGGALDAAGNVVRGGANLAGGLIKGAGNLALSAAKELLKTDEGPKGNVHQASKLSSAEKI